MTDLTIICNNVPRDIVDARELTEAERADFDYLDWKAIEAGEDSASFVRYKGELIDLGDLERWTIAPITYMQAAFDAYRSDSFFSGLLFRYVEEDGDWRIIVGRYYT